jgi:O-antigen/teichoic acid export membrane protein
VGESRVKAADSTFKPALMLMSGRALAFAVTFFVPAVLARLFLQAEFGTYKQFYLITYTLYGLGQLGLAECLFYFLPADPSNAGRYAFNSLVMLGVIGVMFAAALLVNSSTIAVLLSNPQLAEYLPLACFTVVFMLMGTVLEITMICRKQYRLATTTYAASDVFRAAFLIFPALVTRDLWWTLVGAITFCLLRVLTIVGYFRREFGSSLRFDSGLLRNQIGYALPFTMSVMVQIFQQNYHQYAVSFHFDAATFAIYSVGCLQIPLIDFMATPASNVMMVQMGEHLRDSRRERLLGVWQDTTRKLSFVFFPMVALLIVSAPQVITLLFTKAYAASIPIFMVWSLSILFAAFQTDGVLRVFAQNRWLFVMNIARLTFTLLLMSWFLGKFQLIGAVFVTLLGMSIAKTLALVRIKRLLNTTVYRLLPWKQLGMTLLVSMLAAVPASLLNARLQLPEIVTLPISGVAYITAYATLILGLGLLTEGEKRALWLPLTKIRQKLYVWNSRHP